MKNLFFLFALFIVVGCGGGGSTSNSWDNYESKSNVINDNSGEPKKYTFEKVNKVHITLNLNTPKDVYVIATSHFNYNEIKINDNIGYSAVPLNSKKIIPKSTTLTTPQKVLNFRKKAYELLHKKSSAKQSRLTPFYKNYSEDDSETFCVDMNDFYHCTKEVNATVRKIVDANTAFGNRELIVWVEDDVYNDGSIFSTGEITQEMVNELANTFLKSESNNDIYDWVTNVFGKEWGTHNNNNLIGFDGKIHILIYKMDEDHVAGYFWSKDNYKKTQVSASNEKIMFYVNSTLYSGNVAGFDKDKAKKETFSTLAHEFQHMIHFYQKDVLKDIDDATWFNEMLSEATEDLIATKIEYKGPRNVDFDDGSAGDPGNNGGRYPHFNCYDYFSLTLWNNDIAHYGIVSSFGAFLLRNYGGAKVLHDLEKSNYADEKALESVTNKSLHELLQEWATGVLLSDKTSLPSNLPQYNFGDFKLTTLNEVTYKLGSINFFNYENENCNNSYLIGLYFSNHKTINKNANLYYEVGKSLSGKVTIDVSFSKGGDVTIVTK